MKASNDWWNEYGFFGNGFYMLGDNSIKGFWNDKKLTLEERTRVDVDGVIRLTKLQKKEKVLDIPCGYGRHSIELALRGYEYVTGLDFSRNHLGVAYSTALSISLDLFNPLMPFFARENMLELNVKSYCDVLINMCYSFGFFASDAENEKVLQNFFKALRPGGRFLMETDVNLPYVRSGKFKEKEKRNLQNGGELHIVERFNPANKRMEGCWTIYSPHEFVGKEKYYSVRVYEVDEFIDLCKKVGFKDVQVYSDWEGNPYDEDKQRIIFVASK